MPTVLYLKGWRFFFYSDEGNEPIHIHVQKGDSECKYWLDIDLYEICEAYSYGMSSRDTREVKKIILQNFDEIVDEWQTFRSQQNG